MLGWAKDNPQCVTVLVRENLARLKDFFNVEDTSFVQPVAENIFPILSDAGVRLQLVLDNIFDTELGEDGKMLMSLARAAHGYGQVIAVTQSEGIAKEVAHLNGARTRLAPQQENVSVREYRWNEMQAYELLLYLNATKKVKNSSKPRRTRWWRWWCTVLHIFKKQTTEVESQLEKAVQKTTAEFKEDELLISKTLDSASMPYGSWKPVDIKEFLLSGRKPVTAIAGAASAPQAVWVCQLQPSKDGEQFELTGNPFKITASVRDVDDLKEVGADGVDCSTGSRATTPGCESQSARWSTRLSLFNDDVKRTLAFSEPFSLQGGRPQRSGCRWRGLLDRLTRYDPRLRITERALEHPPESVQRRREEDTRLF
ncbi:unnamed protein product [Effrenium voratum]|uniref:Uncharacterized protein n=1 Tax=Effrenium voratum TaxID=2562239 RepID=A0AA36N0Z8_9DINO|nr:unnamed protein product [Effrenium voratum]